MNDIQTEAPNWEPLIKAVGKENCGWFMWMCRVDGVEEYKHKLTRRTLPLPADDTEIDNMTDMIAWVQDRSGEVAAPANAWTVERMLLGTVALQETLLAEKRVER